MNHARLLNAENPDPRMEGAALYQMAPCSASQMMGYLLRTADGKLFCIDGGTKAETDAFLALARQVVRCPAGERLHIDGWFLTHPHNDHIDVFIDCVKRHKDDVDIAAVYYNFPSTEYQETYEKIFAFTCHDFEEILDDIAPFAQIVHTGDVLDFGSVTFAILSEPDESIHVNTGNNSSVAIRASLEGQTILFLGDMGVEEGNAFLARYGEDGVKADFVEMAHHGQNGVDVTLYGAIAPKACLWCTPDWLWKNDAGGGYGTGPWKTLITRCCTDDLGVKHHFIEKDGIWEIPLPYAF